MGIGVLVFVPQDIWTTMKRRFLDPGCRGMLKEAIECNIQVPLKNNNKFLHNITLRRRGGCYKRAPVKPQTGSAVNSSVLQWSGDYKGRQRILLTIVDGVNYLLKVTAALWSVSYITKVGHRLLEFPLNLGLYDLPHFQISTLTRSSCHSSQQHENNPLVKCWTFVFSFVEQKLC